MRFSPLRADTSRVSAFLYVVEDDDDLRRLLVRSLLEEGFEAEGVASGSRALQRQSERAADAFVLDIGLPDADGRDLCQALRAQGVRAPVLFLTALDAVPDRISGFRAGGDDYVTKPFAFGEVVARLRALLRRGGGAPEASAIRRAPHRSLDAFRGLRRRERRSHPDRVPACSARSRAGPARRCAGSRSSGAAWPHGAIVSENTIDVYIARLRRKLRQLPAAPAIATAHGVGYALRE